MVIKKSDLYRSIWASCDELRGGGMDAASTRTTSCSCCSSSYDYVVANPPFSDKAWSTGLTPANDPFQRFAWGQPPTKQGDYAYLLHIVRSMKSMGKAGCILPHGVLFRGNAEGVIRQQLVRSGVLKEIIGLPGNLFYGTGIPACIVVLDKETLRRARACS